GRCSELLLHGHPVFLRYGSCIRPPLPLLVAGGARSFLPMDDGRQRALLPPTMAGGDPSSFFPIPMAGTRYSPSAPMAGGTSYSPLYPPWPVSSSSMAGSSSLLAILLFFFPALPVL
ncbi:unnamed protein product, partial [Urochloa humidicola]